MAYLLTHLLSKSTNQYPDKPAVWAQDGAITYRELEERSNQLAHLLRERGLKNGERVGIYMPKSLESVISMFATLKAGGIYVPLDPQAPAQRIAYIIGDCGIKALVSNAAKVKGLEALGKSCVEFNILTRNGNEADGPSTSTPWRALSEFPASHPPACPRISTDLAYILYTSGSTGKPKGVMLSHLHALTFIEWCGETFQIRPDDRLSNHAPLHFDLSVFDIYGAIQAGATVYLLPDQVALFPATLAGFLESEKITVWYSVPSALVQLVLHAASRLQNLKDLRLMLFAGEVFPMKYLRQLADLLPNTELYNLYGPTETNVCTYYRVDRAQLHNMEKLPIGWACANTEVFAVNEHDKVVTKPGDTGELFVRGTAVTPGYWGDLEKTNRAVVHNRFQPQFGENMYRTGDVVILREDGGYDFVGRRDNMVKSHGYRIELGEIETALLSHPAVKEAVALAIADEEVGARIKAVVAPHDGTSLTPFDLQKHCATKVPKYMIPELIEMRSSLPKTSTGKVDRVQLASARPNTVQEYEGCKLVTLSSVGS